MKIKKTPVPENNTSKGQKKKESSFDQIPKNFNMKPFSAWRREWRSFSMLMACVVVFVTTYSLILPAISMEIDEAQEMEGVYLDDGDFSVEEAEPDDGDSPEGAEIDYETVADASGFTDDAITSVDGYDLAEDIEGAADALAMVSTLEASAAGVDVKLTYPEDVSADTAMTIEAIDRDAPEGSYDSYYYGAADEISRAYPDWSVFDAGFWHAESVAGSDINLEINFRPAVYDEGVSVFDADGPLVYEDGRLVYVIGGLEKGIETGKVIFVDWTDMWHLYESEDVHIETFENGIVRISVETDALMNGAAVFGVVVLEENETEEAATEGDTGIESMTEVETKSLSVAAVEDYIVAVPGEDYVLHVSYGEDAGIPADPEIVAIPIEDEEYAAQAIEEVKSVVEENTPAIDETENVESDEGEGSQDDQLKLVGLFDLTIYHDGNVIRPQAPVTVSVEFNSGLAENEQIYAVHFPGTGEQPEEIAQTEEIEQADVFAPEAVETETTTLGIIESDPALAETIDPAPAPVDTTPEVIAAETSDDTAVFATESLSYIAIVSYTVDFHWNVDGQEFTFSIPGGGYTTLSEIVRILGIVGETNPDDEASEEYSEDIREFMEDVADVEVSSSEFLSVSKVEESTTIGAIKERLGLECEYSAELTQEEIEEINGSEVEAVDWALISLKAFTSEESLTVIMKDGESFEIRVTDEQEFLLHFYVNNPDYGYFSLSDNGKNAIVSGSDSYSTSGSLVKFDFKNTKTGGVPAIANTDGRFYTWLCHDGSFAGTTGGNSWNSDNKIINEESYIAYFAPTSAKIAVIKPFDTSKGTVQGGVWVDNNSILPQYLYSNSGYSTLTATPQSGYFFKGWFVDGNCISTDTTFDVSTIRTDVILEPVFDTPYTYTAISNCDNEGKIDGKAAGGIWLWSNNIADHWNKITGTSQEYQNGLTVLPYSVRVTVDNGFDFAYWLKDDGTLPEYRRSGGYEYYALKGLDYDSSKGSTTTGPNKLDRDTSYIAFFVPEGEKVVRLNYSYPDDCADTGIINGSLRTVSVTTGDIKTFYYAFTGNDTRITAAAKDPTKFTFLGWYHDWDRTTETGTLVSTDASFLISNSNITAIATELGITSNLNLTPVFTDHYNVWFDGTNGINGMDWTTRNNTLYSRINGRGEVEGAQDVYREVKIYDNTINLPTVAETRRPQGYDLEGGSNFILKGWYDIYNREYYYPDQTVTITADSVFYADWFAETYNIGQNDNDVFNPSLEKNAGIVYPDTSSFITTDMYDYNSLFNMPSIRLRTDEYVGTYEDADKVQHSYTRKTNISKFGNYEYWEMAGSSTRDFLFISAVSGDVRTLSPIGRKDSLRNQSNETSRDGGFYTGNIASGIMSTEGLREDLFNHKDSLGKRYVGEADFLYLYDTKTGYYYYDSDKNAASYNQSDRRFYVYDYTNWTDKSVSQGGTDGADFLPFNYGHGRVYDTYVNNVKVTRQDFRESYGEPNYWFGMKSSIDFFLPNASDYKDSNNQTGNRSIKGDEMIFKFCGDDDVWVYVDDQLFLDLGGIHGKVYGEINFSQGTCTIASSGAKKTVDTRGIMSYDASESDPQGGHAGLVDTTSFYLPEGDHTVTIYYLERGSSQSNCAIYFNLAPRYSLELHKQDQGDTSANMKGAKFAVYTDEACTLPAPVKDKVSKNKTHIVTTDANGYAGWTGLTAGKTYYIKEISPPSGYPDVSVDTIVLTIDSLGNATVKDTAENWTMTSAVTYSEDNAATKGQFLYSINVYNRKQTSVITKKIWTKLDGSSYAAQTDNGAWADVKLQRYYYKTAGEGDNAETCKVHVVARYLASDKEGSHPSNNDDGTYVINSHSYDYEVLEGKSISLDISTLSNNGLAIYSVAAQPGTVHADIKNNSTGKPYYVNLARVNLPTHGVYTVDNIHGYTVVYVTFIGSVSSADLAEGAIQKIENDTTTGLIKKQDSDWNSRQQSFRLSASTTPAWRHEWTDLETQGTVGGQTVSYYYYVVEVDSSSKEVNSKDDTNRNPWGDNYLTTYSGDGVASGTITVHNTLDGILVKLRKQDVTDSSNKTDLAGAEFSIYTDQDCTDAITKATSEGWRISETYKTEEGVTEGSETTLVSDNDGIFYYGYLPKGTYYIRETKAPERFARLANTIRIVVSEAGLQYDMGDGVLRRRNIDATRGWYNLYIENRIFKADVKIVKTIAGTANTPLAGAKFSLHASDGNGGYQSEAITGFANITTGSDGIILNAELEAGTYYLVEDEAPAGYNSLTTPAILTVGTGADNTGVTLCLENRPLEGSASGSVTTYYIPNNPGVILPATGGPGTKYLYLLGTVLTALAGIGLITKRRKEQY